MTPFPTCLEPWIAALSHSSVSDSVRGFTPNGAPDAPQRTCADRAWLLRWNWRLFLREGGAAGTESSPDTPAMTFWFASPSEAWVSFPIGRFRDVSSSSLHHSEASEPSGNAAKVPRAPVLADLHSENPHPEIGIRNAAADVRLTLQSLSNAHADMWPHLESLDACPQEWVDAWKSEQNALRAALQKSRFVIVGDLVWILIPCDAWSLVAQLLASRSPPPPSVVEDWSSQWQRTRFRTAAGTGPSPESAHPPRSLPASPVLTLVSQSGLLCPLDTFLIDLAASLRLDARPGIAVDWIDQQQLRGSVVTWPSSTLDVPGGSQSFGRTDGIETADSPRRARTPSACNPATSSSEQPLRAAQPTTAIEAPKARGVSQKPRPNRAARTRKLSESWIGLLTVLLVVPLGLLVWRLWSATPHSVKDSVATTTEPPANRTPATPTSDPSNAEPNSMDELGDQSSSTASAIAKPETRMPLVPPRSDAVAEMDLTRSEVFEPLDARTPEVVPSVAMPTVARMLQRMESQLESMRRTSEGASDATAMESPIGLPSEFEKSRLSAASIVEQTLSQAIGSPPLATAPVTDTAPITDAGMHANEPSDPSQSSHAPSLVEVAPRQFAIDPLAIDPRDPRTPPFGEPIDLTATDGQPPDTAEPELPSARDHVFPIRNATEHVAIKVGRGASSQFSRILARFVLAEQALPEMQIAPEAPLHLEGPGKIEWRVAIEDTESELIVRLTSKPGAKWQFATQVGVRLDPSQAPILLGPDDSRSIIRNLGVYEQWLRQSIETMSNTPFSSRSAPGLDVAGQLRVLRGQLRECEMALKRWKEIHRLSVELFGYGAIEIQLEPRAVPDKDSANTHDP